MPALISQVERSAMSTREAWEYWRGLGREVSTWMLVDCGTESIRRESLSVPSETGSRSVLQANEEAKRNKVTGMMRMAIRYNGVALKVILVQRSPINRGLFC